MPGKKISLEYEDSAFSKMDPTKVAIVEEFCELLLQSLTDEQLENPDQMKSVVEKLMIRLRRKYKIIVAK
ncbi:hypothetical protein SARC_15212, partial [Sphaeroforma arctica JP610]